MTSTPVFSNDTPLTAVKIVCRAHPTKILLWLGMQSDGTGPLIPLGRERRSTVHMEYNPVRPTMKWEGHCPVRECRAHVQYVVAKVSAVLDALADPGREQVWQVTDEEMAALVRRPDLARAYLAQRDIS